MGGIEDLLVDGADLAYPGDALGVRELKHVVQRPVKVVGDERDLTPELVKRVGHSHPDGPSGSGIESSP